MARRRRTKSKTQLKSCLKDGPPLSPSVSRRCFVSFNKCRSPGRKRKARRR